MSLGNPDRAVGGLAVAVPPGIELRPVGRDDFTVVLELLDGLHGPASAEPELLRPRFDALVNDPDATPFLALEGGRPIGFIGHRLRRRLNHATFEGSVSDLVVAGSHRGRGIGRALLAAAVAEWRLRGGHQMMLEVGYERAAARVLVEGLGFVNRGKWFRIEPVVTRGVEPGADVEIRPIRDDDDDFAATTRLLAELGRPAPRDETLPALRRTYDEHVRRSSTASLLALVAGEPVGFVSLEFFDPFVTTRPRGWIPDLIVTEAARGRHVGAALLDAAFAEAARRDADAVTLESGDHRTVAHRLYAAAGMADAGSYYTLER